MFYNLASDYLYFCLGKSYFILSQPDIKNNNLREHLNMEMCHGLDTGHTAQPIIGAKTEKEN